MKELLTSQEFWVNVANAASVVCASILAITTTVKSLASAKNLNATTSNAVQSLMGENKSLKRDIVEYKKLLDDERSENKKLERMVKRLVDHIDKGE